VEASFSANRWLHARAASYQDSTWTPASAASWGGGVNNTAAAHRPLHEDRISHHAGRGSAVPSTPPSTPTMALPFQPADASAAPSERSKRRVPITREIAIEPPLADG